MCSSIPSSLVFQSRAYLDDEKPLPVISLRVLSLDSAALPTKFMLAPHKFLNRLLNYVFIYLAQIVYIQEFSNIIRYI